MSITLPLQGCIAIVTGATGGIDSEVSRHLASLGASLILVYSRSSTKADLLTVHINSNHPTSRVVTIQADVTVSSSVQSIFNLAEKKFNSKAHILVTCAGILDPKYPTLANTTDDDWYRTMNVNAKGTFLYLREAANCLIRGGGGRVITFSSSIVGMLLPGYSVHTVSNAAVVTMTKILAKELKGTGITANTVAPGTIETELFLVGKSKEFLERVEL